MASQLTQDEISFLDRVAAKIAATGFHMEDACRAVLADDRRIFATVQAMRPLDRGMLAHQLAKETFAAIHTQSAREYLA